MVWGGGGGRGGRRLRGEPKECLRRLMADKPRAVKDSSISEGMFKN